MSENLTEFENATVGMWVGVIEVLCLQPINYMKNMVQQGQKIIFNPAVMYRGVGANCVNMGSCTMLQFAVGGSLKQVVLGNEKRQLTDAEQMMCGLGGGIFFCVGLHSDRTSYDSATTHWIEYYRDNQKCRISFSYH